MTNNTQNPGQKAQDNSYSNQSKQGVNSGQKGREGAFDEDQNTGRNANQQNDIDSSSGESNRGGTKNNTESRSPRREREEEDRPRAGGQ